MRTLRRDIINKNYSSKITISKEHKIRDEEEDSEEMLMNQKRKKKKYSIFDSTPEFLPITTSRMGNFRLILIIRFLQLDIIVLSGILGGESYFEKNGQPVKSLIPFDCFESIPMDGSVCGIKPLIRFHRKIKIYQKDYQEKISPFKILGKYNILFGDQFIPFCIQIVDNLCKWQHLLYYLESDFNKDVQGLFNKLFTIRKIIKISFANDTKYSYFNIFESFDLNFENLF